MLMQIVGGMREPTMVCASAAHEPANPVGGDLAGRASLADRVGLAQGEWRFGPRGPGRTRRQVDRLREMYVSQLLIMPTDQAG
jgi:hypothetical protein